MTSLLRGLLLLVRLGTVLVPVGWRRRPRLPAGLHRQLPSYPGGRRPPTAHAGDASPLLVPAHDEEPSIGRLLASTRAAGLPAGRFDVHVVADNCTDRTAEVARAAGAQVDERFDQTARGKGYALRWLLGQVRERGSATMPTS